MTRQKVIYRFTPRILSENGGTECMGKEKTITIWVHPKVNYTTKLSDFNGYNISCHGLSNGYISINISPDLAPYTYSWTGPEGFTASVKNIRGLSAGEYTMVITDRNGCSVTETFMLNEPEQLAMTIEPSVSKDGFYNIDCAGAQTGTATVTAINNVGPVIYRWDDGNAGRIRTELSAGTYKVLIIDSNNCHAESEITLTEPERIKLDFDVTNAFCPDKPDGEIKLTVTGGVSVTDYEYKWSDGSTDKDLSDVLPGIYKVTVTDFNECSETGSAEVKPANDICLVIPEAISPNNDLINDVWIIENLDLYPQVEIIIYNRWGQELWRSEKGYPDPWDGRSKGVNLPVDGYHYVIDLHNGAKMIPGAITIVR